ncbi:MAG: tRNA pseudouridine(13) synthase TruD [Syntrophotaleaceae bacterium]
MNEFLTRSHPGTGGSIKETPEDFYVEEIALYPPCGEGEHLYLTVEKKGITTFELIDRLAKALSADKREIGYAGIKDACATTRQTISIPRVQPEQALALELEDVRILSAAFHRNKLRMGHLAGNRFLIRIRNTVPGALDRARDILHILEMTGVPNFFGEQRYGVLGNSHLIGGAILREDFEEAARQIIGAPERIENPRWRRAAELFAAGRLSEALAEMPDRMRPERNLLQDLIRGMPIDKAVFKMPHKLLKLYLSAFQSSLFDRIVAMRLASLDLLWPGDLAFKHDNGACFVVTDPGAEQPRADRLEISPSGPMYGFKVRLASGQAGIIEESLLEKEKLDLNRFRSPKGLALEGERRPLRVPLKDVRVVQEGADLLLSFSLPKGSYATSLLREVMKPLPAGP